MNSLFLLTFLLLGASLVLADLQFDHPPPFTSEALSDEQKEFLLRELTDTKDDSRAKRAKVSMKGCNKFNLVMFLCLFGQWKFFVTNIGCILRNVEANSVFC